MTAEETASALPRDPAARAVKHVLVEPTTPTRKSGHRDWRPGFLAMFAATGSVLLSARAAGVNRTTPYEERAHNAEFAAAWQQAEEDAIQLLEAEARRRALSTSDVLLIFLLKARRPSVYRENPRIELTGADGGPILTQQLLAGLDDHEKALLRAAIDRALVEEKAEA